MSGLSRYCFHGVPAILPMDSFQSKLNDHICSCTHDTPKDDLLFEYLSSSRININVRQVSEGGWPREKY